MVNSKNTGDQIVYHLPRSMRVVGGILLGIGILFFAIGILGGSVIGWLVLIIPLTLPGLFFYTYTAEWTFDHSSGYIAVRRGCKPFPRFTMRISKTDVQSVDVHSNGDAFFNFGRAQGGFPEWILSIKTNKKKLRFTIRDKQTAYALAARIREFTRSP